MSTAIRTSFLVVLPSFAMLGAVGCMGRGGLEDVSDQVAGNEPAPEDMAGDSSAPLVAAVRQYFHHLDQHWVQDDDHVPPGLPLTDEARAEFVRKVGTIAETHELLAEHGIAVDTYDDEVSLVGEPTFASDSRSSTAQFTIERTREFQHAKFDHPQRVTVSDPYVVNFVRSQESSGLGRWLISSIATLPVPPDDTGSPVPPGPALGTPASADVPASFQFEPKAGISLRMKGALQTAVVDDPLAGLDYAEMAAYAKQWTVDNTINPEYPNTDNNCQNLVSQALFAGGWPEVEANVLQYTDDSKWDGHIALAFGSILQETLTWRTTTHWMTFATNSGRVKWMPELFQAALGDVIQTDWDPNGMADGKVDHAMIVTSWDEVWGPHISQQSHPRNDIALVLSMQLAEEEGKTRIVWYLART